MNQKSEDLRNELTTSGQKYMAQHEAILAASRKEISDASNQPSFHECLDELRDTLLVLEATRNLSLTTSNLPTLSNLSDSPHSLETLNHPHWRLVLHSMLHKLYPAVSLIPDNQVYLPFVPRLYDLMQGGLFDLSSIQGVSDHLNDSTILHRYIGEQSITTSEYLSALQVNVFRLIGQKEDENPRSSHAELVIFYVATNIGVQRAIEYLEALWNDGWLHDVSLYSHLWLGLQIWQRSNPKANTYRNGRQKYLEEIVLLAESASIPATELLSAAHDMLKRTRKILHEDRLKASDLSHWIRCVHQHWLPFTGISQLKNIAERNKVEDHLLSEFTQIWRYCMEATADIKALIGNPFRYPLGQVVETIVSSSDKSELERKLRFLNYGRITFPEVLHRKIMKSALAEIEGTLPTERGSGAQKENAIVEQEHPLSPFTLDQSDSSFEKRYQHIERIVSDLLLFNLRPWLQVVYTIAGPLTFTEAIEQGLPKGTNLLAIPDNQYLSQRSQHIAKALQLLRCLPLVWPTKDDVNLLSFELDSSTQLRSTWKNGFLIRLSITGGLDENQDTAKIKQEVDQEDDARRSSLKTRVNYPGGSLTVAQYIALILHAFRKQCLIIDQLTIPQGVDSFYRAFENLDTVVLDLLQDEDMRLELKKTEKKVEILSDLLNAIEVLESHSLIDWQELKRISIDIVSSNQVLYLEIGNGTLKAFYILPRQILLTDQEDSIDIEDTPLLGVSGVGLFTLLKQKSELLFRGKSLNNIPINCVFARTESGYRRVSFGTRSSR